MTTTTDDAGSGAEAPGPVAIVDAPPRFGAGA